MFFGRFFFGSRTFNSERTEVNSDIKLVKVEDLLQTTVLHARLNCSSFFWLVVVVVVYFKIYFFAWFLIRNTIYDSAFAYINMFVRFKSHEAATSLVLVLNALALAYSPLFFPMNSFNMQIDRALFVGS